MASEDDAREKSWHLDKRVPIAFVLALLLQTSAALVWAGSARERMARIDVDVLRVQELAERSARLEEQVSAMRATLERIEVKLDRLSSPAAR